ERGARVDFLERGPENSRPQRALKVWLSIQAFGRDGYAAMIDYNIRLAAYMEGLVKETPPLVLAAPRELSIVCWRVEPGGIDGPALEKLQIAVIEEIERRGIAQGDRLRLHDPKHPFVQRPFDVLRAAEVLFDPAAYRCQFADLFVRQLWPESAFECDGHPVALLLVACCIRPPDQLLFLSD